MNENGVSYLLLANMQKVVKQYIKDVLTFAIR